MEIIGSNFSITLGSWRLRIGFALEDIDAPQPVPAKAPHRVRVVSDDEHAARRRASAN
jgi:hypothetical protein